MSGQNSKLILTDKQLFLKKLCALIVGTLLIIPLVYYKFWLPALIYVSLLLVLHIFVLYMYFARTPWRLLTKHKAELALRILAIMFFVYLLTLVKFEGSFVEIVSKLLLALFIHVCILCGMMVVRVPANTTAEEV